MKSGIIIIIIFLVANVNSVPGLHPNADLASSIPQKVERAFNIHRGVV